MKCGACGATYLRDRRAKCQHAEEDLRSLTYRGPGPARQIPVPSGERYCAACDAVVHECMTAAAELLIANHSPKFATFTEPKACRHEDNRALNWRARQGDPGPRRAYRPTKNRLDRYCAKCRRCIRLPDEDGIRKPGPRRQKARAKARKKRRRKLA